MMDDTKHTYTYGFVCGVCGLEYDESDETGTEALYHTHYTYKECCPVCKKCMSKLKQLNYNVTMPLKAFLKRYINFFKPS